MAAILDFPTVHHQTEYLNGFPMSEDIKKRVLFNVSAMFSQ